MRYLILLSGLLWGIISHALTLQPNAPARYVVQPGDTLWEIAQRYLVQPWDWKALWHANPHIKNPNQLYAGAVLELRYHHQQPYLKVVSNGTVKLSPFVRTTPLEEPIPPIPLNDLKPFLNKSLIIDKNSLAKAPYVIAFTTEHLLGGQGDEVYVKNLCPKVFQLPSGVTLSYAIYRPCGTYRDPATKRFLGYKAALIAYAELVRAGDPATILITDLVQGVKIQDRVMPNDHPDFDLFFLPKAPSVPVHGLIIDLLGDFTQGAVGLVAVLNKGNDAGVQAGDVLGIYSKPKLVNNGAYRYDKKPPCESKCITLPAERIGELMIFRTFSRTSIGLVVRSTRVIKRFDSVTNP
ncbi:MAG: LysM peptidoglycan-binding domain-containing protein [Legionellales bacterium]|nr:LysM peptidoglycan-binding domain-containing protein [Legionellales bacterium]